MLANPLLPGVALLIVCAHVNLDKSSRRLNRSAPSAGAATIDTLPPLRRHWSLARFQQLRAKCQQSSASFLSDILTSSSKLGSTPYPPMPVFDVEIGRKGRCIDQVIALLFQRRYPLVAHVRRRGTANVIAFLDAIGFLCSYCSVRCTHG